MANNDRIRNEYLMADCQFKLLLGNYQGKLKTGTSTLRKSSEGQTLNEKGFNIVDLLNNL
jgi:hypothetical protein